MSFLSMTSRLGISIDDGLMDIAFTNALNLTVWFGNGRGGFTVGPTAPVNYSDYLMLGDFDGDGRADLAIGDRNNYDSMEVLYGDGTGHFPVKRLIQTSGQRIPLQRHRCQWRREDGHHRFAVRSQRAQPDRVLWQQQPHLEYACRGSTASLCRVRRYRGRYERRRHQRPDCGGSGLQQQPQQGNAYITVLTRNGNSTYNPEQLIHTSDR